MATPHKEEGKQFCYDTSCVVFNELSIPNSRTDFILDDGEWHCPFYRDSRLESREELIAIIRECPVIHAMNVIHKHDERRNHYQPPL